MKKIFLITISLLLAIALVGCSTSNENATPKTAEDKNEEVNNIAVDSNDILIAYYSYSGNTEKAAKEIQAQTNGTLSEITRNENYPENYDAEQEILNEETPDITMSVEDIENYDVIFIGYPIWWNKAPAMIRTLLTKYDFSGKTIIPFCTSSSDGIENSLEVFDLVKENANLKEGLRISNYEEILNWLQKNGIVE